MTIAERLLEIRDNIETAESRSLFGQKTALLAVSKGHGADAVCEAITAGQKIFAENRVQEAAEKFPELRDALPDLELHLIGPLQTNKVKDAVALFDVIHTVDRAALADKLAAEMQKQDRHLPCFIQVNTGEEPQKAGALPQDLPELLAHCCALGLNIVGLMCIPPVEHTPAIHFAFLKKLAKEHGLEQLSMGMSSDYEAAIKYGATHIRIGSAIFGDRVNSPTS